MKDYISREAAIAELNAEGYTKNMRVHKRILAIPAADVREVVRGDWEEVEVMHIETDDELCGFEAIASARCNQCNRYHNEIYRYGRPLEMAHFCPHCGADVRGEADGT